MEKETRLVRFNQGDVIFRYGDESRNMYIIRSGRARVLIQKKDQQIPLTELGQGQYIGEMSFLSGVKRSATVIAETPVTANCIPPDILQDEDMGLAGWAVSIAKVLVQRLRATTELLGDYIVSRELSEETPSRRAEDLRHFEIGTSDPSRPGRLYLKGQFTEEAVEPLKKMIREMKLKNPGPLVLDFSEIMDIDQAGISYLFELTRMASRSDHQLQIENIQLIRDKVLSLKGVQSILTTTHVPVRRLEKDEFLIRFGEVENLMYVVKSGSFSISRKTKEGRIQLGRAEAGDVIGEMSLIKDGLRSADVQAEKPSVVHVIDAREFYSNIYNVPRWFMDLIKGLVERLRDTNEMLEQIGSRRKKEKRPARMTTPLGVVWDSAHPGRFVVSGTLNLANLQYLIQLIRLEMKKETRKIVLDLSKVRHIEKECIAVLLGVYAKLKARGIEVSIRGPQKDILYLQKQYGVEE